MGGGHTTTITKDSNSGINFGGDLSGNGKVTGGFINTGANNHPQALVLLNLAGIDFSPTLSGDQSITMGDITTGNGDGTIKSCINNVCK